MSNVWINWDHIPPPSFHQQVPPISAALLLSLSLEQWNFSILCKVKEFQKEERALEPRDSGIRMGLFSCKEPTTIIYFKNLFTGDVNVRPQDRIRYVSPHPVSCRVKSPLPASFCEKPLSFERHEAPVITKRVLSMKVLVVIHRKELKFRLFSSFFWDYPLAWSRQLLAQNAARVHLLLSPCCVFPKYFHGSVPLAVCLIQQ